MKKVFLHDFMFRVSGKRDFSIDLVVSHDNFECNYHDIQTISLIDSDVVISNFLYSVRFKKPDFLFLESDTNNHIDSYMFSKDGFEVAFILEDVSKP